MLSIPRVPDLGPAELGALTRLDELHAEARKALRQRHLWSDRLQTVLMSEAARASSYIENVVISTEDALAAAENRGMAAEQRTADEHRGTQRALSLALAVGRDPSTTYDIGLIRSLHFVLMESQPLVMPGRWRHSPVRVGSRHHTAYTAPDCDDLPELVDTFVSWLRNSGDVHPVVRAAMAHFILALIHPFMDGNGRTARALESLVLTRETFHGVPTIEPYMAAKRADYYRALLEAGGPIYSPNRDATPWVRFAVQAHWTTANLVVCRALQEEQTWLAVAELRGALKLPERLDVALFDAALGRQVTNAGYRAAAGGLPAQTATRDLNMAVRSGLLVAQGRNKAASYAAGDNLLTVVTPCELTDVGSVWD